MIRCDDLATRSRAHLQSTCGSVRGQLSSRLDDPSLLDRIPSAADGDRSLADDLPSRFIDGNLGAKPVWVRSMVRSAVVIVFKFAAPDAMAPSVDRPSSGRCRSPRHLDGAASFEGCRGS